MRARSKFIASLALGAALLVTAFVYWPGLSGGYVFDDFPNIVDNADIHVTQSTLANWANAAFASPSSVFKRPLASLTFAANWFFSGGNPWPMKVTNLGIHLLNGVLLFFMLCELLRAWRARSGDEVIDDIAARRLLLVVTAAWLLAPINLMAVLYVVQRMESLCQVFVLAGLWMYLAGRARMLREPGHSGFVIATAGLVFGTALGLLSKESAALMPVYAFLVECTLLGFVSVNAPRDRRLQWLFVLVLWLPALLGLARILPGALSANAWDGRSFTLGERLLTEARVLIDYLRWIVLPDPSTLSVYHDEIVTSRDLLHPWTTLPSIALIIALLALAVWLRKRRPLISLGILWFFAAQLLTGTVIPLELVYEHRNYFASIGVLLVLYSLLLGLRRTIALPILRGAAVALLLLWSAAVTHLRAQDWSSPLRLAFAEANRHPDSPRANYEAGRLLIIASDYAPGPALDKAKFYLQRASSIPGSSSLPEQAQIMIADHVGYARDDAPYWNAMIHKLHTQPTAEEDISALISLTQCKAKGDCHFDIVNLQRAFAAALSRPAPIARLLGAYADFARDLLLDDALSERYLAKAVVKAPRESAYRVELARQYALTGQTKLALQQIAELRRIDTLGRLNMEIAVLQGLVAQHSVNARQ